jgi:hypothetical protein
VCDLRVVVEALELLGHRLGGMEAEPVAASAAAADDDGVFDQDCVSPVVPTEEAAEPVASAAAPPDADADYAADPAAHGAGPVIGVASGVGRNVGCFVLEAVSSPLIGGLGGESPHFVPPLEAVAECFEHVSDYLAVLAFQLPIDDAETVIVVIVFAVVLDYADHG